MTMFFVSYIFLRMSIKDMCACLGWYLDRNGALSFVEHLAEEYCETWAGFLIQRLDV